MTAEEVVRSFLMEDIEKYLYLDPNGDFVFNEFYHKYRKSLPEDIDIETLFPWSKKDLNILLHTSKALEEVLLNWVSIAEPSNRHYYGNRCENLEMIFEIGEDEIRADIENGVYYFSKYHHNTKDLKDDTEVVFAIIHPKSELYSSFTSELTEKTKDCFGTSQTFTKKIVQGE